jgi:hypothetical protein
MNGLMCSAPQSGVANGPHRSSWLIVPLTDVPPPGEQIPSAALKSPSVLFSVVASVVLTLLVNLLMRQHPGPVWALRGAGSRAPLIARQERTVHGVPLDPDAVGWCAGGRNGGCPGAVLPLMTRHV